MYMVSLAPRANNYLIEIIAQNNFAQVETCIYAPTHARTHARSHDGRKATIYTKNLVLDSFVHYTRLHTITI